jgi:hypothetical protein
MSNLDDDDERGGSFMVPVTKIIFIVMWLLACLACYRLEAYHCRDCKLPWSTEHKREAMAFSALGPIGLAIQELRHANRNLVGN